MVSVGLGSVPMPWDDCTPVDGLWVDGVMLVEKVNTSAEIVDPDGLLPTRYGLLDKSGSVQALPGLDQDSDMDVLSYLGGDRYLVSKMSARAILSGSGEVVFPYVYYYYDLRKFDLDTGLAAVTDSGRAACWTVTAITSSPWQRSGPACPTSWTVISVGSWYDPSGPFIPYVLQLGSAPVPADPEPGPQPAGDAPSSWAAEQVDEAIAAGLVPAGLQGGYGQPITRRSSAPWRWSSTRR